MTVIYKGRLAGEFTGFDQDMIFETATGLKWKQKRYKYWYYYEYMPEVEIRLEDSGEYFLYFRDQCIAVERC